MPSNGPWKQFGRYGSVGIELVLSMMLGYYAGHWLDVRYAHDAGYVTGIGMTLGIYAGFRQLYRVTKQATRELDRQDAEEKAQRELALKTKSGKTATPDEHDDDYDADD
jgi:F0F1-type ATP synthase assembly protein I